MSNNAEYMAKYISARQLRLKIQAIEYKGGKCQECGYNKCYAALEFHHRDPNDKEVSWKKLRSRSWKKIEEELDKCDLLCANCHREEHWDPAVLEKSLEFLDTHKAKRLKPKLCKNCKKEFKPATAKIKYCSHKCSAKDRMVINWPKDLASLVVRSSKRAVALQLGVSDTAVTKRLNNMRKSDKRRKQRSQGVRGSIPRS